MAAWNRSKYGIFVASVLNSTKFRKNIEIPRKRANSAARLKIPRKTVVPNSDRQRECSSHSNTLSIHRQTQWRRSCGRPDPHLLAVGVQASVHGPPLFSVMHWKLQDMLPESIVSVLPTVAKKRAYGTATLISGPGSRIAKIWNSLLPHILQSHTLPSFRRHLKTHYFQSAYPAS